MKLHTINEYIVEMKTPQKMTVQAIAKLFKNESDWGDLAEMVRVVKGRLEVIDTYFYSGQERLDALKKSWTEGDMAKYFIDKYNISFKIVDSFNMIKATGRYKKISTDGIVGIILEID